MRRGAAGGRGLLRSEEQERPRPQSTSAEVEEGGRVSRAFSFVFPQIAGSYRGSYFSMAGLLIAEIG